MRSSHRSRPEVSASNKSMIICSIALIVLIVFYYLLCKPKVQAREAMEALAMQQRAALQNAQRELRDMPDADTYQRQLQEEEARVKSLLPDREDISGFLVALNALSKEQHIKIAAIKQGAFTDHKTYYEIPLDMTVIGTYPDLLRFIKQMETLRRFNSIRKIGAQAEKNLVTMQLSAVIYVYGTVPSSLQVKYK